MSPLKLILLIVLIAAFAGWIFVIRKRPAEPVKKPGDPDAVYRRMLDRMFQIAKESGGLYFIDVTEQGFFVLPKNGKGTGYLFANMGFPDIESMPDFGALAKERTSLEGAYYYPVVYQIGGALGAFSIGSGEGDETLTTHGSSLPIIDEIYLYTKEYAQDHPAKETP